jgi:hypothetical protein
LFLKGVYVFVNVGNWTESKVELEWDTNLIVCIFGTLNARNVLKLQGSKKVEIFYSLDAKKLIFFPKEKRNRLYFFDGSTASTHGHIVTGTLLNVKIYL